MIGNATGNPGASLYITDDGSNNHYSGSSSTVFATRTFNLDTAGEYAYSYDWKCNGESTNDYLRATLFPAQTIITPGQQPNAGSQLSIPLDGGVNLCQHTLWQSTSGTFTIDTPGVYIWLFQWHNDSDIYNQTPAAVDNVNLKFNSCPLPRDVTGVVSADSLLLSWIPVGNESSWGVQLSTANNLLSTAIVSSPNHTFNSLPLSSSYIVRIRTICGDGDTSLTYTATFLNNRHLVTVSANDPAFGQVTGGGTYYYGDIATLIATPNDGYDFIEWSDGNNINPRSLTVTRDTNLVAHFQLIEDTVVVGIDDPQLISSKSHLRIYPNPASGAITISVAGIKGNVCIQILDLRGGEVTKETIDCPADCEKSIDIKGLSAGAYIVRVTSESINPMIRKLIVK
jgi:hypothetical protein